MKLQLNVGDWATIALFALGVILGCYEQPRHERPASASQINPAGTAIAALGRD